MSPDRLNEFDAVLERVKAVPGPWKILPSGKIRHASLVSSTDDPACPLCSATGRPAAYDNNEVLNLAVANGLNHDQGVAFMNAADTLYDGDLRPRILEACGLTPETPTKE